MILHSWQQQSGFQKTCSSEFDLTKEQGGRPGRKVYNDELKGAIVLDTFQSVLEL